jgi:hypothetical protein
MTKMRAFFQTAGQYSERVKKSVSMVLGLFSTALFKRTILAGLDLFLSGFCLDQTVPCPSSAGWAGSLAHYGFSLWTATSLTEKFSQSANTTFRVQVL